jgi:hypothetical protein
MPTSSSAAGRSDTTGARTFRAIVDRTKRWTALINGVPVLGGRAFPSRDKAAIQILLHHEHRQDRATRNNRRRGSR